MREAWRAAAAGAPHGAPDSVQVEKAQLFPQQIDDPAHQTAELEAHPSQVLSAENGEAQNPTARLPPATATTRRRAR
jgi:hypothetical protein